MTQQNMLGLLTVFNCENSHPQGDLVFVHGLAGHPWGTWHPQSKTDNQNVELWPFWLGENLRANGIDINVIDPPKPDFAIPYKIIAGTTVKKNNKFISIYSVNLIVLILKD